MEQKTYTAKEAADYLGISRATFFLRVQQLGIKPVNYNPALMRQKNPKYAQSDIDKIKSGDFFRAA